MGDLVERKSLIEKVAAKYSVDPEKMLKALKATAFKSVDVSNEQMMALLVVSDQYNLNPWTKEIYAFPDKHNGIIPVVGVDGWSRIINSHDNFDGMDFNQSDKFVEGDDHKPCPEWIECVMYRKDRAHAVVAREYFDECYRPPFNGKNGKVIGPWQTHTKRFLRHKAMIQAARIAFGFVGIFDPDEAERIQEYDITPKRTSAVAAVIEHNGAVFDHDERDAMVEAIDNCFTLDPASGLELVDPETFDEMWAEVNKDAEFKIGVWDKLPSKVRTYISAMEKG